MSVYSKLLQAQKELTGVSKDGHNTNQNYKYATEPDVIHTCRGPLGSAGIVHFVETVDHTITHEAADRGFWMRADVIVALHLYDPDDNTEIVIKSAWFAHDKNGDKALFKAITGATKYAYLKGLALPTGDDPEHDSKEDEGRAKAQQTPKQNTKPAPKAQAEPDPRPGYIEMYAQLKAKMATLSLPEPIKAFPDHKAFASKDLNKADLDQLEDLLNLMASAIQEAEKGA